MKKQLLSFSLLLFAATLFAQQANPIILQTAPCNPVGVAVKDNIMYLGEVCDFEVTTVDLTQGDPKPVNSYLSSISFPGTLVFRGNDLYMTIINSGNQGAVSKVDITDNTNTVVEIANDFGDQVKGLAFNGDDLYVGVRGNPSRVDKLDLTQATPSAQNVVTGLSGFVNDIVLFGNDLYIAHSDMISKIDITQSNPTASTFLSGLDGPVGLTLLNNLLFVVLTGDTANKVSMIDLSNPSAVLTDFVTGLGDPWSLYIDGNTMYIVEQTTSTISSVDISTLSIDDFVKNDGISLISNEAKEGIIKIQNPNFIKIEKISLFNVFGQNIAANFISNGDLQEIQTQRLASGIYFLKLQKEDSSLKSIKFIVE